MVDGHGLIGWDAQEFSWTLKSPSLLQESGWWLPHPFRICESQFEHIIPRCVWSHQHIILKPPSPAMVCSIQLYQSLSLDDRVLFGGPFWQEIFHQKMFGFISIFKSTLFHYTTWFHYITHISPGIMLCSGMGMYITPWDCRVQAVMVGTLWAVADHQAVPEVDKAPAAPAVAGAVRMQIAG